MVRSLFFYILLFTASLVAKDPYLKLQAVFTGQDPMYPGQQAYVGYRYLYNTSIDLIEEQLPLLDNETLKKIGDKQISEKEEGDATYTQVVQKIEATSPGKYTFGPSIIKGRPKLKQTILESQVGDVIIEIVPFPKTGQPPTFNGAIGTFRMKAELKGSPKAFLGDVIGLRLIISGKGEWNTVQLPNLCCQPGFSGFFKQSDLPPKITNGQNEKIFELDLTVINGDVKAIPSIEFAFFEPETRSYHNTKTDVIPLTVSTGFISSLPPLQEEQKSSSLDLPEPFTITSRKDWEWPFFLIATVLLSCCVFFVHYRYAKEGFKIVRSIRSPESYLQEALAVKDKPLEAYLILEKALQAQLKKSGPSQQLDLLLTEIQEQRYLPKDQGFNREVYEKVKRFVDEN